MEMIKTNERYTPKPIVEGVRSVMGSIDVDPASNDIAQKRIQADLFYTQQDSGLDHDWVGNVFLNPPYSNGNLEKFADKFVEQVNCGNIVQAIIVTPSDSSTKWFRKMTSECGTICLTERISFDNPYLPGSSNTATNFIFYFGSNVLGFTEEFKSFGSVFNKLVGQEI